MVGRYSKSVATVEWGQSPAIIAHRGGRQGRPNSLAAFEAAILAGADAIEFDVRKTVDGVLIIHHNALLHGMRVDHLTYRQVCALSPERPPTLREVVDCAAGRIRMDIEIKRPGFEAEVLDIARRAPQGSYVITSFLDQVVATCKELDPRIPVGLIIGSARPVLFPIARALHAHADIIVLNHYIATTALIRRAQAHDLQVFVWTVNRSRGLHHALEQEGVLGVITDIPRRALQLRTILALRRHSPHAIDPGTEHGLMGHRADIQVISSKPRPTAGGAALT